MEYLQMLRINDIILNVDCCNGDDGDGGGKEGGGDDGGA